MENKTIEQLLSSLAALANEARGSLFGQDKCMVDREKLLYLVETLQTQLPAEINEARTIIDNCNALRNNAKKDAAETRREADQVLRDAEVRAAKLIEETNIVEFAKKREQEILEGAEQQRAMLIMRLSTPSTMTPVSESAVRSCSTRFCVFSLISFKSSSRDLFFSSVSSFRRSSSYRCSRFATFVWRLPP